MGLSKCVYYFGRLERRSFYGQNFMTKASAVGASTIGAGAIIAGGQAQRLGGLDKSAIVIGDTSCLNRTVAVLSPLLEVIVMSAPVGISFDHYDFPVIRDYQPRETDQIKSGPALAIIALVDWAVQNNFDYVITAPIDTPFLPHDYAQQLFSTWQGIGSESRPVVCTSEGRTHGLHALWPVSCFAQLQSLILLKGGRKIRSLHSALDSNMLNFPVDIIDPFLNLNTLKDIEVAQYFAKNNTKT